MWSVSLRPTSLESSVVVTPGQGDKRVLAVIITFSSNLNEVRLGSTVSALPPRSTTESTPQSGPLNKQVSLEIRVCRGVASPCEWITPVPKRYEGCLSESKKSRTVGSTFPSMTSGWGVLDAVRCAILGAFARRRDRHAAPGNRDA